MRSRFTEEQIVKVLEEARAGMKVEELCRKHGISHPTRLKVGDALDFWRVLLADEKNRRLLLYAEMKLPGEAWLEFEIIPQKAGGDLKQTATFCPNGVWGRFYWYSLYPFHALIFRQLAKHIAKG